MGDRPGPRNPAAASPGGRADATPDAPAGCTGDERDRDAGREAAAVLERLERIGRLERDGAPAASLLGELRELVGEAESWARLEGDRRARAAAAALATAIPEAEEVRPEATGVH